MDAESTNRTKLSVKTVLTIVVIALLAGVAAFFYLDAQNAKQQTPEATQARNQEETERVVSGLGQILLLNSEAEPTVARVEDPSKLQESNRDFYKDVQVDDYLVLYPQRAVIYRESENRIINIAPIINASQLTQTQEEQSTQPAAEGSETPAQ